MVSHGRILAKQDIHRLSVSATDRMSDDMEDKNETKKVKLTRLKGGVGGVESHVAGTLLRNKGLYRRPSCYACSLAEDRRG